MALDPDAYRAIPLGPPKPKEEDFIFPRGEGAVSFDSLVLLLGWTAGRLHKHAGELHDLATPAEILESARLVDAVARRICNHGLVPGISSPTPAWSYELPRATGHYWWHEREDDVECIVYFVQHNDGSASWSDGDDGGQYYDPSEAIHKTPVGRWYGPIAGPDSAEPWPVA